MEKPIFVATHPRACSTAFERVFMTRRDILQCVHEPFGDAYYFGPERVADRYEHDPMARKTSGFAQSTYQTIMERINKENTEGKRLLIKDMAQYFIPPDGRPVSIAPSLLHPRRGVGTSEDLSGMPAGSHFETTADVPEEDALTVPGAPYDTITQRDNPTVVPKALLGQFHFVFLIRHPSRSIPSYYRCCVPPLDEMTGFHDFRPDEAGYVELVRLFDFLRSSNIVGPVRAKAALDNTNGTNGINGTDDANGHSNHNGANGTNGTNGKQGSGVEICVIDADDLLDKPRDTVEAFCRSVGIDFNESMLTWDSEEDHQVARDAFEKWKGFHEDAINSKDLKPRSVHKRVKSADSGYNEWFAKFGKQGADLIQKTVDENVKHYEYLRSFCVEI